MAYDIGDRIRCTVVFQTLLSVDSDPTTITARLRKPDGTKTVYIYLTNAELVKDATGKYHFDVDITASGFWYYRFEGKGALVAAGEDSFQVVKSKF